MRPNPQPWFIRFARRLGAKTDEQALYVCVGVSVALIVITIILYRTIVFAPQKVQPLDPAVIEAMQRQNRTR